MIPLGSTFPKPLWTFTACSRAFNENSSVNSWHRCSLCCHDFNRDARDRENGSEAGGQFNGPRPPLTHASMCCRARDDPSIWTVPRKIIHSGWSENSQGCPLHAGLGGDATQPRLQGQISSPDQSRKAAKTKVAITALMRKLIELANALIKADRNWVKKGA